MKRDRKPWFIPAGLFLLLASCSGQPDYASPVQSGNDVVIGIADLSAGIPRFYAFDYREKKIRFFLVRSDDEVRSYLDACETCSARKLGFRFDQGRIVCRACNEGYPLSRIEAGLGRCFPIRLEGYSEENTYHIPLASFEGAIRRF